jgi:hypothetical protein
MTVKSDLQGIVDSLEALMVRADALENKHLRDMLDLGRGRLIDAAKHPDIELIEKDAPPEPGKNPGFAHPDDVSLNPDGTLQQAPNVVGRADVRKE